MFDLIIGLFGLPRSVMTRVEALVQLYEAEGSSAVLLELHNGAPVIVRFHWNSKTWTHNFELVGRKAKVR